MKPIGHSLEIVAVLTVLTTVLLIAGVCQPAFAQPNNDPNTYGDGVQDQNSIVICTVDGDVTLLSYVDSANGLGGWSEDTWIWKGETRMVQVEIQDEPMTGDYYQLWRIAPGTPTMIFQTPQPPCFGALCGAPPSSGTSTCFQINQNDTFRVYNVHNWGDDTSGYPAAFTIHFQDCSEPSVPEFVLPAFVILSAAVVGLLLFRRFTIPTFLK